MTGDNTGRVLGTVVAALVLVIGGAIAASGDGDDLPGQATSASPSDVPTTDDATTDQPTEDETAGDEDSDGREADRANPHAPCTLTSPPNRAAGGADAKRHPGWSRGKHLGWCVAAARHKTTGPPARPGKGHGKHHGKHHGEHHGKHHGKHH